MASGLHAVGADFLRQPEHTLTDHVLLDLRRSRIDRPGARPQEGVRPRAWLAGRRVDLVELVLRGQQLPLRPEDLERRLVVALLELRVRELGDGRARPRRVALLQGGQYAERRVALHLEIGVDAAQLGAYGRVLD